MHDIGERIKTEVEHKAQQRQMPKFNKVNNQFLVNTLRFDSVMSLMMPMIIYRCVTKEEFFSASCDDITVWEFGYWWACGGKVANSVFTALAEARVVLGVNDSLEGKTLPNSAGHQILKWLIIFMSY